MRFLSAKRFFGLAILALGSLPVMASTFSAPFGGPNFTWLATGGAASPNHIWTAGDYWNQSVTGTGLPVATRVRLNLIFNDNTLTSESLNIDVSLNTTAIHSFVVNPGDSGYTAEFDVASIAGEDFVLRFEASNTISSGLGSVSLDVCETCSTFDLVGVPEPSTAVLLGGALFALFVRQRR